MTPQKEWHLNGDSEAEWDVSVLKRSSKGWQRRSLAGTYRGKATWGMENCPLYLPTHPGLHPNTKGREGSDWCRATGQTCMGRTLCMSLYEADPLQRIWTSLNVELKQSMILYQIKEGLLWGSATSKSYPTGSIVFTPLVSTAHEQIKTALFLGHTKYKVAGNSWHVFV